MQLVLNKTTPVCPLGARITGTSLLVASRPQVHQLGAATKSTVRKATYIRAVAEQASNGAEEADACEAEVVVKIDNQSDAFSTIVTVEFGSILGELLDTVQALKGLGLNIRRAKLAPSACGSGHVHKFYVTDARTSEKVVKSAKIEELRLTILNTMLQFHPEAGERLAWGSDSARNASSSTSTDPTRPLGGNRQAFVTQIAVREDDNGIFTQLLVNTVDRPGLLTDIVSILKDINLNVLSAEVDTIGRNAVDTFNVTYHGEPLSESMRQLAVNCLQYYLSKSEVEKDYTESY